MAKTRKHKGGKPRRTLRTLRKKGGAETYDSLTNLLTTQPTFGSVRRVLDVLEQKANGNEKLLKEVEYYKNQTSQEYVASEAERGADEEHLQDMLEDVKSLLNQYRSLIDATSRGGKRKLKRGGADTQALIPPNSAFKHAAPVNSDNAWYKIA